MLRLRSWIRAIIRWGSATFLMADVVLLPAHARACAVCISWTEGQGLNGGFYWSALLLTALPFVVVAVIGAWVGCAAYRARPRHASGAARPRKLTRPVIASHAARRGL